MNLYAIHWQNICLARIQYDIATHLHVAVSKIRTNIKKSDIQVILGFTVITDLYRSYIKNKTAFTENWLTRLFQTSPEALKSTE